MGSVTAVMRMPSPSTRCSTFIALMYPSRMLSVATPAYGGRARVLLARCRSTEAVHMSHMPRMLAAAGMHVATARGVMAASKCTAWADQLA